MNFNEWVKARLGKKVDYDRMYGVQCVDLVNDFADSILGVKGCFYGVRYAKEIWTKRSSLSKIKSNFDFITPTYKNGELKPGDIGIRTSGTAGHIFVIAEPTANGKIRYYDQNATNNGDAMSLRTKAYNKSIITGVLRPKNQSKFPKENKSMSGKYGNADMLSNQNVYADSTLEMRIGSVSKGEGVYYEGNGDGNCIIIYRFDNNKHYKAGFVKGGSVKKR